MEYFKNISYMNSHIFLLLFFYLFTVHRFSKKKTIGICICAFLLFNLSDCLKLNLYPDSDLCYFLVTIFQILVAQLTNLLISSTRDSRVLFVGLSACFEKEYIKNWWELCLIPVFFYCGFSFLAFFPYRLEDNPNNISGVLIFIVTMFVSYVVVLRYVESESKRSDIYWRNVLSECYIKDLENQYHSVEQFEQNLKILRHDIRHYSGMIEHLLDQKEYGEVRNLVKHINDVVDENKIVKYCNHLLMNTILFNMMEKARSLDIYVNLDTVIGKSIPVDEYEFAAVLANLFENALMCVQDLKKEKRYVDAKIQCTEECLLIDIKNECEKEVVMDSFTGLPKSSKGKNHGLGMLSISAFADKIGGNIGCYCENGIFQIIIFAKF